MAEVATHFLKAALRTLYYTRLDAALAPITQGAGVIFMLHHVRPHREDAFAPNDILAITPEFLELVVTHVKRRDFDIVSMDEAYERMRDSGQNRRRFATFTFDDGYRDNIDYALPVMRRHDVPMLIYLAPDFCDGQGRAWWLTLEAVLKSAGTICVAFESGEKVLPLGTPDQQHAAWRTIYSWLRNKSDAQIHEIVDRWANAAGIDPQAACRDLVLRWDEVREAARDPLVSFGAHTMSHAALAKCSNEEARWQIELSVEHVEHELRGECRHFAYPYGDAGSAGAREFAIARDVGLKTAVTTRKGLIGTNVRDKLTALPRLSLNGDYQDERLVQVLLSGAPFKMLELAQAAIPRRAA